MSPSRVVSAVVLSLLSPFLARAQPAQLRTRNVVLVMDSGMRWQEVFRGADPGLFNKEDGGVEEPEALRRAFGGDTPERRRERLMPFFWTTIARNGLVLGNRDRKSPARATNPKLLSYACHNEMLTGRADPRIDFNDKRPNPNVTVLEWLTHRDGYRGRVVAVGGWDVLPWVLNVERSGIPVNTGWEPIGGSDLTSDARLLNRMMENAVRELDDVRDDVYTFRVAMEALPRTGPRVLMLDMGVDDYAHRGRYDLYLQASHQFDANLKELWETLQSHPKYRDTTTLIVATDHGRGHTPRDWRDHNADTPGSDEIWLAVLGPDTPRLGERADSTEVTLGQVAATIAALLGELAPFHEAFPHAAPPISFAIGKDTR